MRKPLAILAALLFVLIAGSILMKQPASNSEMNTVDRIQLIPESASIASFAGGCFWCIETAFEGQAGVYEAVSGYAEGEESTAEYYSVASGQTKHREAVQVYYDAEQISYEDLLTIFWRQIDPTDPGGQFADRGFHYSTAIYAHTPEQRNAAEASKAELDASGRFEAPIVTEILPHTTFFLAEEKHQDYARKQREHYQRYKKGSGRADFIETEWSGS